MERTKQRVTDADEMYCPRCEREDRRIALIESPRPARAVPQQAVGAPPRTAPVARKAPPTELVRRLLHARRPPRTAPGKTPPKPRLP